MGDGTKLAIAIAVMWLALLFFFFAFHPGGVQNVSNPAQMLQWLLGQFTKTTGGTEPTNLVSDTGANQALSYPGFSTGTSNVGNATPNSGVQVA